LQASIALFIAARLHTPLNVTAKTGEYPVSDISPILKTAHVAKNV